MDPNISYEDTWVRYFGYRQPLGSYNIDDWNKVGDFRYIYEDCYFTITTESSESHDLCDYHWDDKVNDYFRTFHKEMFLTEKITRPMLNLHPQIIYGASGTLEHLHSLGFKTFSNYWNEDYDHLYGESKLNAIMNIIADLGSKSLEELHEMYWDMMPILKFNQEHLLNMRHVPVLTIDDWHKYSKDWQFAEVDRIT